MAKVVSETVYLMFKAVRDGVFKNDINPDIDKNAQKGAEQIRAKETPNFIKSKERGVTDYSNAIPEEGRVVVKGVVKWNSNEKEALKIANEKAEEKSKQKGNSQKGISRE